LAESKIGLQIFGSQRKSTFMAVFSATDTTHKKTHMILFFKALLAISSGFVLLAL